MNDAGLCQANTPALDEVRDGRPVVFRHYSDKFSGGSVAYGDDIYQYLPPVHPGAVWTCLLLVFGVFFIYICV